MLSLILRNTPQHLIAGLPKGSGFVLSRKRVDKVHETVSQMLDAMNNLDDKLSKLITALDEFWRVDYPYFYDADPSTWRNRLLENIEKSHSNLRKLSGDIKWTRDVLKDFPVTVCPYHLPLFPIMANLGQTEVMLVLTPTIQTTFCR